MNEAAKEWQPSTGKDCPPQGSTKAKTLVWAPWYLLAWTLGVVLSHRLPQLPTQVVMLGLMGLALLLLILPRWRWLGFLLLGACYALWAAHGALLDRLPARLTGHDIQVRGEIIGLPEQQSEQQRFELQVSQWQSTDPEFQWRNKGPRIRVSWYGQRSPLQSGDSFAGTIRLRAPVALINPGSFDFERHALAQGLDATAYVRDGRIIARATAIPSLDAHRQRWSRWISRQASDPAIGALLAGLAVGDQAGIDDASWQRLRVTGTTHLMAISGLHIGLVAAFGAWLMRGLYWLWPGLALRWTRPDLAGLAGLATALLYACLAGWSLPVLRTILMIALVVLGQWTRRSLSSLQFLLLAAVLALMLDPLAPLSAGFWLSFLGVFSLMLALPGWRIEKPWQGLWRAQWVATLFLLPIGIAWFQQASVIGPLANLLAIPWVTFAVVPLLLLAMLCPISAVSSWLVQLAGWSLGALWQILAWCEQAPWASIDLPEANTWVLLLAMAGALLLLTPKRVPGRWFGLLCLLPLFWPRAEAIAFGQVRISVLDVGQGLSVLVQTEQHSLLYDTGARTRGGFDLGEVVVVPALRSLGVQHLDRLIISHLDNDHAGGRQAVLRAYPDATVQVGIDADPAPRCEQGERWSWDGVLFEFLHPPRHFPDLGNESSCVLLIQAGAQRALIPGDIGADIESRLSDMPIPQPLDLLVVAHHGSRYSSSQAFLAATRPELALISSGFANRFGHPSREALVRLKASNARIANTASAGMLQVLLGDSSASLPLHQQRQESRHYWRWTMTAMDTRDRR